MASCVSLATRSAAFHPRYSPQCAADVALISRASVSGCSACFSLHETRATIECRSSLAFFRGEVDLELRRLSERVSRRVGGRWGRLCLQASLEAQLEDAATHTVDYFVRSGMAVGLGTGPASSMAIHYLGAKLRDGSLRDVVGVPICGAQGSSRPGVHSEGESKAIAKGAKQMVFIIEEAKFVAQLEGTVPVIIRQENWLDVAEEIDDLFLGDAEVWRRPSRGEAGPLGGDFPLVTADGHFVLDIIFTTPILSPGEVADALETIDGVVDHGLVLDTAYAAAIASMHGVKIRTSLFKNAFTSME